VLTPELADLVLRDPHIITGVDHSKGGQRATLPCGDQVPSVPRFFELWYTVGEDYARFNSVLRKVFTARVVASAVAGFTKLADQQIAGLPVRGDLARDYFGPYFLHSTFELIGVPPADWPNLTKVARLVIHLFKQQLRGVAEHSPAELRAFETVIRYLKALTDRLLATGGDAPFLTAARTLADDSPNTWPIAALIGQLLMAGIEPMIVGSSIACRRLFADPGLLAAVRAETVDIHGVAEEILRQHPPFGDIFRFVRESCACLGLPLTAGTVLAIDIAAVNLHLAPAHDVANGCPVRHSSLLTFGKGGHYCLGANSARLQVATALRQLVVGRPTLSVDLAAVRIDTHNNLKEVRAIPYRLAEAAT
jgi:cytochrome P450